MTKAEIRTRFLTILNNTECTDALADTFIDMGETRSQRLLKLPLAEYLDEASVGDSFDGVDIPSDFIRMIAVYYESSSCSHQLEHKSLAEYLSYPSGVGVPRFWTRNRSTILIRPTPAEDTTIKMLYYGEFEDFASDADETPLSIISPDLYVYGGLCYAADHFIDERLKRFEERYQQIIIELQNHADEDELSGGAVIAAPDAYRFNDEEY